MIKKGDRVRITTGEKKRFTGTVERLDNGTATVKLFHDGSILIKPVEHLTKY